MTIQQLDRAIEIRDEIELLDKLLRDSFRYTISDSQGYSPISFDSFSSKTAFDGIKEVLQKRRDALQSDFEKL